MRMHMRRFTRLTNAFSKKLEHHAYAVALHQMYYNFVRIHQTLKVTPAMAAGVTQKLWEVSDIVGVEAWETALANQGASYEVERVAIGNGYKVRRIERYETTKVEFFPMIEAAQAWVTADKASHRPGRRRLSEKSN